MSGFWLWQSNGLFFVCRNSSFHFLLLLLNVFVIYLKLIVLVFFKCIYYILSIMFGFFGISFLFCFVFEIDFPFLITILIIIIERRSICVLFFLSCCCCCCDCCLIYQNTILCSFHGIHNFLQFQFRNKE